MLSTVPPRPYNTTNDIRNTDTNTNGTKNEQLSIDFNVAPENKPHRLKGECVTIGGAQYYRREDGGYYVLSPIVDGVIDHSKQIMEHRLVYELAHGQNLAPGIVVHHVNGNGKDNRPENLIAMTNSDHSKLHSQLKKSEKTGDEKPASKRRNHRKSPSKVFASAEIVFDDDRKMVVEKVRKAEFIEKYLAARAEKSSLVTDSYIIETEHIVGVTFISK